MILYWLQDRPHVAVANDLKEITMHEAIELQERNEITRNEVIEND